MDGKRCLVCLDVTEKKEQEIWNALLTPFDEDPDIVKFYSNHLQNKSPEGHKHAPFSWLDKRIRTRFAAKFGAPLTGRISGIIPFFPFSPNEAAVVAHKEILSLTSTARKPVTAENHGGRCHLNIVSDGELCKHITDDQTSGYSQEEGARSIIRAVRREVKTRLTKEYLTLRTRYQRR
ncbi:hypothetical protein K402DRAFT_451207 [Aulographum hederae CBS 113979]|uniref:Uncharacterized protein n=1 Tax=Aulographum hederae CBS 113979 TaxID=1176131 RepID=A0A6G1HAX8_9PEZI|nr:hypothetical protein K402DRAFT_451207 [Aulographum hederae CBS 113979]